MTVSYTHLAEDVGMAVIQFKNGAIATVEGTTNVYPKNLEEKMCIRDSNSIGKTHYRITIPNID